MPTTRLSSKGQVILPKSCREAHHWSAGQAFEVLDTGEGVLLKPLGPFPATTLEQVSGCLRHPGSAKSLKQLEADLSQAVRKTWRDRR